MLLDIIAIVSRETLEAGVLLSLLLSISNQLKFSPAFILGASILGLLGASVYAVNMELISMWFDYVGQEIVNASLQYSIFLALLGTTILLTRHNSTKLANRQFILIPILVCACLAIIREGAELIILYSGHIQQGLTTTAITGGIIGFGIGASGGILTYYGVSLTPQPYAIKLQKTLLLLIGSGMVLQATQLLIQADWVPQTQALWNSSKLLSEQSVMGQFLYSIFGYEATPTAIEVLLYIGALILFISLPRLLNNVPIPSSSANSGNAS
jgi:high-affinity iron transporter